MLKDELLKLSSMPIALVEDALVVNGTRSSFDGNVRAEVKVKLERMRAASFYQGTRKGVVVAVTFPDVGEEANVVTLAGNHNGECRKFLTPKALEAFLHVSDFFIDNGSILAVTG